MMQRHQQSSTDIAALAQGLARLLKVPDCLLLSGDLGVGKTFFAQHIIRALCGEDTHVTSPTFSISQYYDGTNGSIIYHYDLYRLEYVAEIEEIGLVESLECGINLIEWHDIAKSVLPDDALHIIFAFEPDPNYRKVTISGNSQWMQQLNCLL